MIGSRFFINLIEYLSNRAVLYHTERKADYYDCLIRNQCFDRSRKGRKIMALHSDRGGRNISRRIEEHFNSFGTQRQFKISYTPHQNGVAERMNRTLVSLVRRRLYQIIFLIGSELKLSKLLWISVTGSPLEWFRPEGALLSCGTSFVLTWHMF